MFSLLEDDLNKLKTWQVCDQAWPSQRDKIIAQQHWLGLNHFTCTKDTLDRWMSQKEPPSDEDVCAAFMKCLKSDCYTQWHEVADIMKDILQTGAQPHDSNAMSPAVCQSHQTGDVSL